MSGGTTVRAVLFGDAEPASVLGAAPGWGAMLERLGGPLAAVSPGGRRLVDRELSGALAGLLGLDLGAVLVGGWRRHRALQAAALATRDNPAATELVQLARHQVTTAQRPYVDIVVDGAKLATVHLDLGLILDVDGLLGTVRGARLVAVQGGRCTVTASVGVAGVPVLSGQVVIDPAATVALGHGIELLAQDQRPAAVG